MKPTLQQYNDFYAALIDAFPDALYFQRLTRGGLGLPLPQITGHTRTPDIVYDLLQWAEAQGRLLDLLIAARNANPGNPLLRHFAEQFVNMPASQTQGEFERTVLPSVPFANSEDWQSTMSLRELAVCRIEFPEGSGQGTGFLLGPSLVITNYHVVQDLLGDSDLRKKTALRFDYRILAGRSQPEPGQAYHLHSDWCVASSPKDALDFALLRVIGTPGRDPVGGQRDAPARGYLKPVSYDFAPEEPILIFGHPQLGGPGSNTEPRKYTMGFLTALPNHSKRITYNTNTEPGSSGSPCFNAKWDLVALHAQAGNRGITFSAILDRLAQDGKLGELGEPGQANPNTDQAVVNAAGQADGGSRAEANVQVTRHVQVTTTLLTDKLRELHDHQIDALITSFMNEGVNPWDGVVRAPRGEKINTFVMWAVTAKVLEEAYRKAQEFPR
jgi:hypothetical protein